MKKIAINATMLNSKSGGMGVYIRNLFEHLYRLPSEVEVIIFTGFESQEILKSELKNVKLISLNCDSKYPVRRIAKEYLYFPNALSKNKIDLFHSPISYIPLGVNVPAILTVHDLRYFHFPETYTRLRGKFLGKMIPRSVRKAKKIIAVSEHTKSDLINLLNVPPEKVHVVHEGIDTAAFKRSYYEYEWKTIQKKYSLPDRYILSVGHLEPRKNFERLFEAFIILRQRFNFKIDLVLVGQENWYFEKIYKKVEELGLEEHIVFTGFVQDKELPAFYQKAKVFVAPSLFEGFGFTPLEAQAAGTAVVASNITSHPEILLDSVVYFNPFDVDELANKIGQVLLNKELKDDLISRGLQNIKRFDWSECCKRTLQLYMNILEE